MHVDLFRGCGKKGKLFNRNHYNSKQIPIHLFLEDSSLKFIKGNWKAVKHSYFHFHDSECEQSLPLPCK